MKRITKLQKPRKPYIIKLEIHIQAATLKDAVEYTRRTVDDVQLSGAASSVNAKVKSCTATEDNRAVEITVCRPDFDKVYKSMADIKP